MLFFSQFDLRYNFRLESGGRIGLLRKGAFLICSDGKKGRTKGICWLAKKPVIFDPPSPCICVCPIGCLTVKKIPCGLFFLPANWGRGGPYELPQFGKKASRIPQKSHAVIFFISCQMLRFRYANIESPNIYIWTIPLFLLKNSAKKESVHFSHSLPYHFFTLLHRSLKPKALFWNVILYQNRERKRNASFHPVLCWPLRFSFWPSSSEILASDKRNGRRCVAW